VPGQSARDRMASDSGESRRAEPGSSGSTKAEERQALEALAARSSTGYHEATGYNAGKDRLETTTTTTSAHDRLAQKGRLTRTSLTNEMEEMVPSTVQAWSVSVVLQHGCVVRLGRGAHGWGGTSLGCSSMRRKRAWFCETWSVGRLG
jgi:hypothetical protein